MANRLEEAARLLAEGRLRRHPRRGPVQRWVVNLLMREPFPSGGKTAAEAAPGSRPDRERTLARLSAATARYRALSQRLTQEDQGRLWFRNPFIKWPRWIYTFPEIVRVQTTHTRHHARLARAAAASR